MKIAKRLLLTTALLAFLSTLADAGAPFKKVSIAASTTGTSTTTTVAPSSEAAEVKPDNVTSTAHTKNSKLTGIPQIDYIWDPNLPRELHGFNLSNYPFLSTVPPDEDIHFKCDGLHDGFYASIEHHCQVYHHCVYSIRHDFLCANFTAFDQKTFICHFVSDVDCAGSEKYWNRNDNLYMATTTTSTTTTTTEPPPAPRRRPARPLRPLRRPINRRPIDDYYYDDEEYDDMDYYEDRLNRRRKQRPRQRKPVADYEDEYDEKRSFSDDDKPRRTNSRDRYHSDDELKDDYDSDRRKYDRPKSRNKPTVAADRRKATGRKPGSISSRPTADERRSFIDDRATNGRKEKPKATVEEPVEAPDTYPRRLAGRRRISEKRTTPAPSAAADLDDEELHAVDQEEAAEEEAPPKVKTTPKPLEEFVTPKAAGASVYARPRAPPRIARPVPVTEKKKFQYPVQKTATTSPGEAEESDYYDEELYDDNRGHRGYTRRRIVDDSASKTDDDIPPPKRRNHNESPYARKNTRAPIRKPVIDKTERDEYDNTGSASNERIDSRGTSRRRPYFSRNRSSSVSSSVATADREADDVDFVDDDYEERPVRPVHRLRPKSSARKNPKKPSIPVDDDDDVIYETESEPTLISRTDLSSNRRNKLSSARQSQPATAPKVPHDPAPEDDSDDEVEVSTPPIKASSAVSSGRPASVRVVKRPFLPSRGGSPYLPRGLQPVGIALKPLGTHTTDSTPIDMGSTISGVRLLEHGAPILRDSGAGSEPLQGPRTTLPPRSAIPVSQARPEPEPKVTLDELYENDYDVTLNDALNPTLKPLSPHPNHHHNRNFPTAFASAPAANAFVNNNQSPAIHNNNNNYQQQHQNAYQSVPHPSQSHNQQQHLQQQQPHPVDNYNSDSYFSSTDIRRRTIIPAPQARSSRADSKGVDARIAQHFYDDFEY